MSISLAKEVNKFDDLESHLSDMKEMESERKHKNRGRYQYKDPKTKVIDNGQTRKFKDRIDTLASKLTGLKSKIDKLHEAIGGIWSKQMHLKQIRSEIERGDSM